MKTKKAVVTALLSAVLASPAAAGSYSDPLYQGDSASHSVKPAFRVVQGISDNVYNFVRWHLANTLLPGGISRNLKESPRGDSADAFDRNLGQNEVRFLQHVRENFFTQNVALGQYSADSREWRARAAAEQVGVVVDSLRDTLLERYQFGRFGEASGAYAMDRRNWDTGFLAMAGIVGGAFMYFNGVHADATIGKVKLGLDLPSGAKIRDAVAHSLADKAMGGIELGLKHTALSVVAELGLRGGNLRSDRVGLKYYAKF